MLKEKTWKHIEMHSHSKGQFSFAGLLDGFVMLVALVAILPVMNTMINSVVYNTTQGGGVDTTTGGVLILFPLFLILAAIVSVMDFNKPQVVRVE